MATINIKQELTESFICIWMEERCLWKVVKCCKERWINYVRVGEGGGWRIFVGVMKYFKHVLMGHEIFFGIFDGQQNIFLCLFLILTFNKII